MSSGENVIVGKCGACGYPITSTGSGVCPECGTLVKKAEVLPSSRTLCSCMRQGDLLSLYWLTFVACLRGRFTADVEPVIEGGRRPLSAPAFAFLTIGIVYVLKVFFFNGICPVVAAMLPIGLPWGHVPNPPKLLRWPFDALFVDMPCLGATCRGAGFGWSVLRVPAIWNGTLDLVASILVFPFYAVAWLAQIMLLSRFLNRWRSDGSKSSRQREQTTVTRKCIRLAMYGTVYWLPLFVCLAGLSIWSLYQAECYNAPSPGVLQSLAASPQFYDGLTIANAVAFSLSTCCLLIPALVAPTSPPMGLRSIQLMVCVVIVVLVAVFSDWLKWYVWPLDLLRAVLQWAGRR